MEKNVKHTPLLPHEMKSAEAFLRYDPATGDEPDSFLGEHIAGCTVSERGLFTLLDSRTFGPIDGHA
jgi:hypothetical protein